MPSSFCAQSFAVIAVALFAALLVWLAHVARVRPATGLSVGVTLAAWLSIPSAYAPSGTFLDERALWALTAAGVLAALAAALSRSLAPALDRSSGGWLVGFQGFRVPLALCLWRLAAEGHLPYRVAAFGMSLDLITGALAPLVAWLVYRDRALSDRWVLALHGLGLVLLAVVLGEALLVLSTAAVPVLATTPFLWLLTFVVPLALFAHVASMRQVLRQRREPALA